MIRWLVFSYHFAFLAVLTGPLVAHSITHPGPLNEVSSLSPASSFSYSSSELSNYQNLKSREISSVQKKTPVLLEGDYMCQSRPNCEVHVERGANRNGFRITAKGTSCMPRDVQFSLVSNSNKDKGIKNSKTFKPLTKINATKRVYANDAFQAIAEVKTQDYFTIKFDHGVLSDHCSKIVGLQLPSSPAAELHNNFDEDF